MKTCFKCQSLKPLSDFYRHANMADGRLNKCIDCAKKDARMVRSSKIDYYRAYDRERAALPHRQALAKRVFANWIVEHKDRRAANIALGNAVKRGLVKKQPCWVCGEKAVAHHPDYSRPLDVVWLCYAHHKQTHALVL